MAVAGASAPERATRKRKVGKTGGTGKLKPEAVVAVVAAPAAEDGLSVKWDAFQLADQLDEGLIQRELEGIAQDTLVYSIKVGDRTVEALSKAGVDECCVLLARQGMAIREGTVTFELIGDGDAQVALFQVRAARYVIQNGQEVKLDEVLGVKHQPLYHEKPRLSLDSKLPGKKWSGVTWRQARDTVPGKSYIQWIAEAFKEDDIRKFARMVLDGGQVGLVPAREPNPHWYEHGAMKAARNAKYRLIPTDVRVKLIAAAKAQGRVVAVESRPESKSEERDDKPVQPVQPEARAEAAIRKLSKELMRVIEHRAFTTAMRERTASWLVEKPRAGPEIMGRIEKATLMIQAWDEAERLARRTMSEEMAESEATSF